jgi:hypothetical protein
VGKVLYVNNNAIESQALYCWLLDELDVVNRMLYTIKKEEYFIWMPPPPSIATK